MNGRDHEQRPPRSPVALSARVGSLDSRRLDALERIDNAPFSLAHVNIALVAGAGFFTDAYDIFAISIAERMIGIVYGSDMDPSANIPQLNKWQLAGLKASTLGGSIIGQLLFGWLADVYGRKRMYGIELTIIIIATFGQAVSSQGYTIDIVSLLIVWRFILGIGVGADYPMSAVIASEFAGVEYRGKLMTSVVACQAWGQLAASLVGLVIVVGLENAIVADSARLIDVTWRLLIGLGCIPPLFALYFRLTIPETPRFMMDVIRQVGRGQSDVINILSNGNSLRTFGIYTNHHEVHEPHGITRRTYGGNFFTYFSRPENWKLLLGVAYSWFALDIAFYTLTLDNSSLSLQIIQDNQVWVGPYQNLFELCRWNAILIAAGNIPGFIASFLLIDRVGRKPIQLMGFAILTILFWIIGFGSNYSNSIRGKPLFALYCLANFFFNFGPNTTTFIVPAELFPTRYRATAHGIAAACGKLGAVIAQLAFTASDTNGDTNGNSNHASLMLEILSFVMMTGLLSTLLLPETKGKKLEALLSEAHEGAEENNINLQPVPGNTSTRSDPDDVESRG